MNEGLDDPAQADLSPHATQTDGSLLTAGSRLVLTPVWESWPNEGLSSTTLDETAAARPYRHWAVAADILDSVDPDDVVLGTVVQKLHNAVDVRMRTLHDAYRLPALRKTLGWSRQTGTLTILERLGLVRPLVLERLRRIRNAVEHQDRGAPNASECAGLVDTVWYFLRSTDAFVVARLTSFERAPYPDIPIGTGPAGRFFTALTFSEDWSIGIRGWFTSEDYALVDDDRREGVVVTLDAPPRYVARNAVRLEATVDPRSSEFLNLVRSSFAEDLPAGALDGRGTVDGSARQL